MRLKKWYYDFMLCWKCSRAEGPNREALLDYIALVGMWENEFESIRLLGAKGLEEMQKLFKSLDQHLYMEWHVEYPDTIAMLTLTFKLRGNMEILKFKCQSWLEVQKCIDRATSTRHSHKGKK